MSQNDFVIANASGATVRSDINSALQALATLSSGSSAPSTTYANQFWHDDTNDQLKIRDEANTSWIIIATKVGTTWTPYWQGTAQGNMSTLTYGAIAQALVMSAKQIEGAKASVATATTPNLSTAGANGITFTGTTNVTGFTTGQAGTLYYCDYPTGAGFTLTHNATSLKLPTGANITVGAGDSFFIYALGSNNVQIMGYQRADGTALGGAIASQADMEAAASTTASSSPGRQHHHPGHPKFWSDINGTGTIATRASYNQTSITDGGTGRYTFTIATDFSTADWNFDTGANTSAVGNPSTHVVQLRSTDASARAAGSIEVQVGNASSGGAADAGVVSIKGCGDQ